MIKLIFKILSWKWTVNDKFILKKKIKNLGLIKRFSS